MPNVFLDLETIPGPYPPDLEAMKAKAPSNYKKPEAIQKWAEDNQEIEYRKQALDSLQGRILCIGYAIGNLPAECIMIRPEFPDEEDMMLYFSSFVRGLCGPLWIGHGIKRFDIPWLGHRALKYRLPDLWYALPKGRYDHGCVDTHDIWQMTDYQGRYSLKGIASFLGLDCKTGMDGGQVYDYWQAGEYEVIRQYCIEDVETIRRVYQISTFQESVELDEMPA
jgi:hypothetical protein